MTEILDGRKTADKILADLGKKIEILEVKPKLAVIMAGDNPASQIYVRNKQKTAEKINIDVIVQKYAQDVAEDEILNKINEWNKDDSVNAILVQLPLPDKINTQKIIQAIDPNKDADGFTPKNLGNLFLGYEPYVEPCTPKGIIKLLEEYHIDIEGKIAVVLGRSNIVGKPLCAILKRKNAAVINLHSKISEQNIRTFSTQADILISAIGKPNFITADFIKDKAAVIDVGINRVNNKITGDVDFDSALQRASHITPVPGGVGPMTIAMLMQNTYDLYIKMSEQN